ncbi:double zinc ribbon domain-containing protein [Natronobiforma cellulositropha]|uniref:double zinc ribbon domain-containing protein n=1 Tax=Natronobiforma cellulositropha TaxID=1679076 RepID=UPI0021D59EA1|nr:zinc ribbon domain-containing protein [Natronobiforma cellulositropha]
MSKITFRADDDLVDQLEAFDASKSEVMREALRLYLTSHEREHTESPSSAPASPDAEAPSYDGPSSIDDRIRALVDDHLERRLSHTRETNSPQDVNVSITLEGLEATTAVEDETERKTPVADTGGDHECVQCGEALEQSHVYCPNCGEKASRRVFCECGDEVRSDWAFCPSCGRRTPAGSVLDAK